MPLDGRPSRRRDGLGDVDHVRCEVDRCHGTGRPDLLGGEAGDHAGAAGDIEDALGLSQYEVMAIQSVPSADRWLA
jgi:hypothetical protein